MSCRNGLNAGVRVAIIENALAAAIASSRVKAVFPVIHAADQRLMDPEVAVADATVGLATGAPFAGPPGSKPPSTNARASAARHAANRPVLKRTSPPTLVYPRH